MSDNKLFYWMCYVDLDGRYQDTAVDFHPFTAAKMLDPIYTLTDWRIISEKDYLLWKSLNDNQ